MVAEAGDFNSGFIAGLDNGVGGIDLKDVSVEVDLPKQVCRRCRH